MRFYIGTFKAISRCIPRYASLLSPLEDSIKGLDGPQNIKWDKTLLQHFQNAQAALKDPITLTIPPKTDQLLLTVDASPINKGLGGTFLGFFKFLGSI